MSQGRYVNGELVKTVYVVNMASGGGGSGGVTPVEVSGIVSGIIDGVLDNVLVGGTEAAPNIELKGSDGSANFNESVSIGTGNSNASVGLFGIGNATIKVHNNSENPGTYSRLQFITGGSTSSAKSEIRSFRMVSDSAATNLAFFTTASNGTRTERLRITANGRLNIGGTAGAPNIILKGSDGIITSLGGVRIGANDAAHQIDEYEEGTWTPAFEEEGGNTFNGDVQATYTKVGVLVSTVFMIKYEGTSSISDDTKLVKITGFPFSVANAASQAQEIPFLVDNRRNGNVGFAAYSNGTTGYRGILYQNKIRLFNLDTGAPITWADVKTPSSGPTPAFKGSFTLTTVQ